MKSRVVKLYDFMNIAIPAEMCDWQLDEAEIDVRINGLAMEFAQEIFAETVAEGDCVFCRAAENSPLADRTVLLFPGRAIPGAEDAEKAVIGKKVGDQVNTQIIGTTADIFIKKIFRRAPAAINDELVQKLEIDGVKTVSDYRDYFRKNREENNLSMVVNEVVEDILQELVQRSEMDIDDEEMKNWTEMRAVQAFEYMLESGEDPRLPEEGFDILTDEQAIANIAKSMGQQFKELLICRALCEENGIFFTVEDVLKELAENVDAEELGNIDENEMLLNQYYFSTWGILENRAKSLLEGK